MPADKAGLIRVSETDAATTVLASERETGWPDPDITWEDGRCVLVAWFEPRPMSRSPDPGPPYPVYLVMLFDPTGANGVSWVMVDARTGELGAAIGGILPGCPGSA